MQTSYDQQHESQSNTLAGSKRKSTSDFKTAYAKLAHTLIQKALVDQEAAGREALLINEKDVIQFERQLSQPSAAKLRAPKAAPSQPKPARAIVQSEREKLAIRRQLMEKHGYFGAPAKPVRTQTASKPTTRLFDLARKRDEDLWQAQERAREAREQQDSAQCSFQPAILQARRKSLPYDSLHSADQHYFSSLPCSTIDPQQDP